MTTRITHVVLTEATKLKPSPRQLYLILRNNITDKRVTFDRMYFEFQKGFGNIDDGNYWRGLATLHKMTSKGAGVRFEITVSVHVDRL